MKNLYNYLMDKFNNTTRTIMEAKAAYRRFQAHGRTLVPQQDCDPFVFAFVDHGYQAFTFRPDQLVDAKGKLAIVTGWTETVTGWRVVAKTAKDEICWDAEDLEPAMIPVGLVEILRGKVHTKVDEAFA